MIKIHDIVEDILHSDEEALYALSKGFMNLSAYAKQIRKEVEDRTKKDVEATGIVVALSRLQKGMKKVHPLVQDVVVNNITAKSPLTEIVFEKTPETLKKLTSLYEKVKTTPDDFLTMTLGTQEITVIASDRVEAKVKAHFGAKPTMLRRSLASVGLSIDPKYYDMPNITFSLLRRIAQKRIVLAETITTHLEIVFVFHQKDLAAIMSLFQPK